tara:strand:+ start:5709 stop:6251 length:543 start_codon:yes stop_codon:yes gene_type:complete
MNFGNNTYTIERYFLGKDKRLESICRNNLNTIVSNLSKGQTGYGFQNYGMTSWNLFKRYADDFEYLTIVLSSMAREYTKEHFNKEVTGNFSVSEIWGIVSEPYGLATPHNHWPAIFTFVYYLSLPKNNPPLLFTDSGLEIYPEEGELIFFPSWLKHEVPLNKTKDKRICIAGNIYYEEQL